MTGTELATLIRKKTKTNSTTYTDASLLVDVNLMKDELASKIQQVRQEIWNMPSLCDLADDQREYAFPSDMLNNMVNLELKFSASGDYLVAEPVARRHYEDSLQESKIVADFTNLGPRYFIRRQAVYILSGTIVDVTDGIRLVYNSFPAALANLTGTTDLSVDPSTTTHGFPREFHELWARRVSIEYKSTNSVKLNELEKAYKIDLADALSDFAEVNLDRDIVGKLPPSSARGNDGQDY